MLVTLHVGAIVFTLMFVAPVAAAAGFAVLIGASLAWQVRRLWLGGPLTVRRLTLDRDGLVILSAGTGAPDREHRLVSCRILPGAVILGLRRDSRPRSLHLVLPFDALAPEDARELRSRAPRIANQGG